MATGAAIGALVLGAGSAIQADRAASAQNKSQKRAARLERARANLENRKRTRQALAAARRQRAEILAGTQSQNQGTNTGVQGAVGALQTGTAANIGAARADLGARTGVSLILQRGASTASRLNRSAGLLQAGSNASSAFSAFKTTQKQNKLLEQQVILKNPNE